MVKRKRDASNEKGQEEETEDEEEEKDDGKEEKEDEEEEEEADAQEEENLDAKVASMSCPRIWIKVRTEEGAYVYPCCKDARRVECGRSADQAQRCDGGHKCQPYASRAVVSRSRDPVE